MAFCLIEIDSKIIKFEQVGPDICHFTDLSLAFDGHLGNMQIKNCHWVKFSIPGGNDYSTPTEHKINQDINSVFCLTIIIESIHIYSDTTMWKSNLYKGISCY